MKKLLLSAAIVLGSLATMSAQTAEQSTTPTEQTATTQTNDQYKEVAVADIPAAISESLTKAYPDAVLNKAFVNEKKEYKLDIKVGDNEESLFVDENGKWIK